MYTWRLFVYVFLGWGASENAIFIRDAAREPLWRDIVRRIMRYRTVWIIGLVFWIIAILYVRNLLFFFVPPLIIFTLALALTLGPIIVEERLRLSWEPLLTVPYDMRTIVLGKASGALWHIRFLTYAISVLLMCVSAGVGTIGLRLIPDDISTRTGGWWGVGLYIILFTMPILCSLLFILDRMQQYALIALAALGSGTTAPSIRTAMSNAITVAMLIWLVEIAATEAFLTLEQGGSWHPKFTNILSAATLGPYVSYISKMELSHAAVFIGGTLLLRETVISGLWRWALRTARRIPASQANG